MELYCERVLCRIFSVKDGKFMLGYFKFLQHILVLMLGGGVTVAKRRFLTVISITTQG